MTLKQQKLKKAIYLKIIFIKRNKRRRRKDYKYSKGLINNYPICS